MDFFKNFNVLKLSEDKQQVSIMDNDFAKGTLKYGAHLVIPLIDTYLVVLLSIDQICGKNIVLNLKTLKMRGLPCKDDDPHTAQVQLHTPPLK